jgi:transposase-like protein
LDKSVASILLPPQARRNCPVLRTNETLKEAIERCFRDVRRRTAVVGRFPGEMAAFTLIRATFEQDRMKWRGVQMEEELRGRIVQAAKEAIAEKFDLGVT